MFIWLVTGTGSIMSSWLLECCACIGKTVTRWNVDFNVPREPNVDRIGRLCFWMPEMVNLVA